jgi:hypothetical protein
MPRPPRLHMLRNKVITVALGSLQLERLIALRAVSLTAIPAIIQTMNDHMLQCVDIQLEILQTLLSLVPNFPTIHSRRLANVRAFVLRSLFSSLTDGLPPFPRFRLHVSRTAVVSSTVAVALHQSAMFIIDKVVEEDHRRINLESITACSGHDDTSARSRRARRV